MDLVDYLAGQPSFKLTVNLITDEEMGKALQEVRIAGYSVVQQSCSFLNLMFTSNIAQLASFMSI